MSWCTSILVLRRPEGCDVLDFCGSSSGFIWMMARKGAKVGQPIDHKHGSHVNTAYGPAEAWEKIKSSVSQKIVFVLNCSYGSLTAKRRFLWHVLTVVLFCTLSWPEGEGARSWIHMCVGGAWISNTFGSVLKRFRAWRYISPSRFIAALMKGFPELSKSYMTDKRQDFLLEDRLEVFDSGPLRGTCVHHERFGDHSLLLTFQFLWHTFFHRSSGPILVSTLPHFLLEQKRVLGGQPMRTLWSFCLDDDTRWCTLNLCSLFHGAYGRVKPFFTSRIKNGNPPISHYVRRKIKRRQKDTLKKTKSKNTSKTDADPKNTNKTCSNWKTKTKKQIQKSKAQLNNLCFPGSCFSFF